MTALIIGLKRMYKIAKNIDGLVTDADEKKKKDDKIALALSDHIHTMDERNARRDKVLAALTSDIREITREIRPNGGSSMKDQLSAIARDVAVLQQWKHDSEKKD